MIYPHTVTRGPLKGQIVTSSYDHQQKLNQRRTAGRLGSSSGLRGDTVVRIVEAYEKLRQHGIGSTEAVSILQTVFGT